MFTELAIIFLFSSVRDAGFSTAEHNPQTSAVFACFRAVRIADADVTSSSETASDLQLLLESRIKCFNNLAAAQLKVMY